MQFRMIENTFRNFSVIVFVLYSIVSVFESRFFFFTPVLSKVYI